MKAAGRVYQRMTMGWAAWWAPESFYRDYVASELYKGGIHTTPEVTISTLRGLRPEKRGQPPKTSGQRRVDLVVWNNQHTVRAAIEFKRNMSHDHLSEDIKRLREIGRWTNAPQYTLLATYEIGTKRERLEAKLHKLERICGIRALSWKWDKGSWTEPLWQPMSRAVLYAIFRVSPKRI